MGKTLKQNLDLESFANSYIFHAIRLALQELDSEKFDSSLYKSVAKEMDLTLEQVVFMHHSFNWFLFDKGPYSILENVAPRTNQESHIIRMRGKIDIDKSRLVKEYLTHYKGYLTKRAMALQLS